MPDQCSGLLSPFLRAQRLRAVRPLLGPGRVLDYGCGNGVLAEFIDPRDYVGVDKDAETLDRARAHYTRHTFLSVDEFENQHANERFATVVALALIEHVPDPAAWLVNVRRLLNVKGRIVLTTPHPAFRRIYEYGAGLGVFTQEAADDHEAFLGLAAMRAAAATAGLRVAIYRRFLLGANQLFVLEAAEAQAQTQ